MRIVFCDLNYESGSFVKGDILQQDVEAVVSPANSFGFMDGGIDYHYSVKLGWHIQEALQIEISDLENEELLIGQAIAIPTGRDDIKYVISAPTMRVPLRINDPIDIYLATRAATKEAIHLELKSLAFPGMGTGCGEVPFDVSERFMKKGVEDAMNGSPKFKTWREAQHYHHFLREE